MASSDLNVNARITLMRLRNRIRQINPAYKFASLYQSRLMHKRAARRARPGIVR
jgi:hypothetical protein